VENFTRYLKMGYDLVVFSGGKALRGPQAAGLLLGRKDLLEAAALHNVPNTDAIGRTNKVGKEELVAMWAAVDRFVKLDHAAVWRDWEQRVKTIAGLVAEVKGVKSAQFVPPIANHAPHLRITWDIKAAGRTPLEVAKVLREGEPSIAVKPDVADALEVAVWMLEPGQDEIVGKRIRDLLKKT
jgi:D-glucosaminate-6-phosphate ammonia-lyase